MDDNRSKTFNCPPNCGECTMKQPLFLLILLGVLAVSACTTPVEINVDNQMKDRASIGLDQYDNQVDITVKEQPRKLKVYTLRNSTSRDANRLFLWCSRELSGWSYEDEDFMEINLTIIKWDKPITGEKDYGDEIITYPELYMGWIEPLILEQEVRNCRLKGGLVLDVQEFIDGVLVSEEVRDCPVFSVLSSSEAEWLNMECVPYPQDKWRCTPKMPYAETTNDLNILQGGILASNEFEQRCFT